MCPNSKCGRLLKKSEFRLQEFEDNYIEKEVSIRKKVMKELVFTFLIFKFDKIASKIILK